LLGEGFCAKRIGALAGYIAGYEQAFAGIEVVARVPQQARGVFDPRQPAIGAVVGFPEARGLPRHFGRLVAAGAEQRGFDRVTEVGIEFGQQRQRQRRDQVIGTHHLFAATVLVVIGHRHAVLQLADLTHHGPQLHVITHPLIERVGDAVHAADWLEHGRRKLRKLGVQQCAPQFRVQQLIQRQRAATGRQRARMGRRLKVPRANRALKGQLLGQVAVHLQKRQQPRAFLSTQHIIKGITLHGFGQQAGQVPARIIDRLANAERRLLHIGPYLGAMAAVDQHFQRHAKLTAIVEDRAVLAGNTGRAGVEVMPLIECRRLRAAILVVHAVVMTQGPGAPPDPLTRLQHLHVKPGAGQLQGGDQTGDPGAQHQHAGALPQAFFEFQRLRTAVRRRPQT